MLAVNDSEFVFGRRAMFQRHEVSYRRTDFLSVLVVVVGFALLLTLALQAKAQAGDEPCRPRADVQQDAPVLDSAPLLSTGAARCLTESTSASWASAIWGAFTR
jgi:hypothetical protein